MKMKRKKVLPNCILFIAGILFSINSNSQPIVPTAGLVASYPFTGNANDVSGNGNNGTRQGVLPVLVPDRFGNANSAYQFGGCGNAGWILVPNSNSLKFNSRFSISYWFKQCTFFGMDGYGSCVSTGQNVIYGKAGDGFAAAPGIYAATNTTAGSVMNLQFNNKLAYGSAAGSSQFTTNATFPCFKNCEWVHVVQLVDSNIAKTYINASLIATSTINGPANFTVANTMPLYIGKMDGSWYPFNGVIDDMNIYNRALTPQEILGLHGGYVDPLKTDYVAITSISTVPASCGTNSGTISLTASNAGGVCQYSKDNGITWQSSGVFSNLIHGTYNIAVKNTCARKDTNVTISNSTQCCGQKVFFVSTSTTNAVSNIWVMDSSGTNLKYLFNDTYHRQALSVTSDGTMMVYSKRKNPNGCYGGSCGDSLWICTSNIDGTNEQQRYLLPNYLTFEIRHTAINSAKTKVIFSTFEGVNRDGEIYELTLATNAVVALTNTSNYAKFGPEYSPEGSKIIYSYLPSGWNAFPQPGYTMNSNGTGITPFNPSGNGTYGSSLWASFKYNPDGSKLVYTHTASLGGSLTLYTCNADATGVVSLGQSGTSLTQALFSATGANIAFTSNGTLKYITTAGLVFKTINPTTNSYFNYVNWVTVPLNPVVSTITQSICQGQTYLGHNTSGTYVDTLVATNGCDSIRTLNLTVKPKVFSTITQNICQGQSYLGHSTPGIYVDTLLAANGCDSIRTLNLSIKPKSFSTITQSICEGQSYLGHSTAGIYIDTLLAANGCDSIRTLNLTINPKSFVTITQSICQGQTYLGHNTSGTYVDTLVATNGCDSIRTLNLTVKPKLFSTITQNICQGQSYLGHSTAGIYVDTLLAANGCDSIRTLNLTIKPKSFVTITQSICQGQSYLGHSTPGIYVDTLLAANGCDSIRTLNLTIKPKLFSTITQSICQGQSYLGHSIAGIYVDTLLAASGCDSIRTLNLTIKPKSFSTITQSICEGQSYLGHSTAGIYVDTLLAASGCDSIRTLNLSIKPKLFSTITQSICQGQSYLDHSTAGIYVDTLLAANGCDSVRTLNLIIKPKLFSTITQSICQGQSYLGYSTAGIYVDTLLAASGCDSIRTLNLTVKPKVFSIITQNICEGQSYLGHSTPGIYVDTLLAANGCDSIRTLNLSIKPKSFSTITQSICQGQSYLGHSTAGIYVDTLLAANGCDSIRTLNLTIKPKSFSTITQSICQGQAYLGHNTSGTYVDTLIAASGCDSIRTLNLRVNAAPLPNLGTDKNICLGDSLLLNPGSFSQYLWHDGSTLRTYTAKQIGAYTVTVWNGPCVGHDTFNIQQLHPIPSGFLLPTTLPCKGETLTVNGYKSYLWSTGETSSTITIKRFDTLSLKVTSYDGCQGIDSVIIKDKGCAVYTIVNAFSPNSDGINDGFAPKFSQLVSDYQFRIFNRWGNMIFSSSRQNEKWDGRLNGKDLQVGVYYYILEFKDVDGIMYERSGSVTMVR
jgi:gliding motility-associated-like protein